MGHGRRLLSGGWSRRSFGDGSEVPVVACNICARDPPTNPVVTTCGHSFCWRCLSRFLLGQAKPCPVCTAMLGRAIHVVPRRYSNGALVLCLPTVEELERNYTVLDWIRTNTVLMPRRPRAALSRRSEIKRNVVLSDRRNRNCERNLFLTSRIEVLQWRARRRAKLIALCKSWESWSRGKKDK